jgi:phasin
MADATIAPPKAKTAKAGAFEMPKFEMPKFDMPKVEMPAAFREFAERGVAQAKDTYEKMKAAAEEATDVLETTYSTATKGASDYGLKMIEVARTNTNAAFDFAGEMMAAKTLSEMVELSSAHARKQFETLTAQSKELTALAQKVATETAEPLKAGMTKAFNQAQANATN